jgi:predicted dehydrogenase
VNVAIIGCGLIGQKRARSLSGARLVVCADNQLERAKKLADAYPGVEAATDWKAAVTRADINIVIVSTTHDALPTIALEAIAKGKHVLIEKPAARFSTELDPLIAAAEHSRVCVRVGFNHRYHAAFRKAHQMVLDGAVGPLMYIRARYGHGGRPGYEKEWRADPKISGGGELIDQGVHLIDLARWFLGDFTKVSGRAHTYFWPMRVDDNAFMVLETATKQTAFMQVSCTEWKNLFSFEIFGRTGKLEISGLGGSYGTEQLSYYRMLPQMGPPETTRWEFPMQDDSWECEFADFLSDIQNRREASVGLRDVQVTLRIVEKIYRESGYDHHA